MPGNMLIPPLCEQLIGHCTAHQAARGKGEAVGLDASAWHSVHHRPHLATASQLAAESRGKKTHFLQLSLRASTRHIHPRDVGKEMLAQLASSRDGDRYKDTH